MPYGAEIYANYSSWAASYFEDAGLGFPALSNSGKTVHFCNPDYFLPFVFDDCCVASVDMVRFRLKVSPALDVECEKWSLGGKYSCYTSRTKPGAWRSLHNWEFGTSSVTLGVGRWDGGGTLKEGHAFLEFNPNKLMSDEGFLAWLWMVRKYCIPGYGSSVVRWDFAVDYPIVRSDVHLMRDKRKYQCVVHGGVTEYLGVRNTSGFCKVYDKAAESDLDSPLTRVELTLGADMTLEKVQKKWPRLVTAGISKNLTGTAGALAKSLSVLGGLESWESFEPILDGLDKRTVRKVRDALESADVPFPVDGWLHCSKVLLAFDTLLNG